MKHVLFYISALLFIFSLSTSPVSAQIENDSTDYTALSDSLTSLLIEMQASTEPDPSIGISYIKMVTENKVRDEYERASDVYLWGISGDQVKPFKDELENELARLEPLLSERDYKGLRKDLKRNRASVLETITAFWKSVDPTPTTPYNERLIEHWERIDHVKENFNRSDDGIFQADVRAFTYIKYGQPDKIIRNVLQVSMGEIIAAARQLAVTDYGRQQAEFVAEQAFNYHINPRYEVWIYDGLGEGISDNIVKIYGQLPEYGFGEAKVLEDFIPSRAFSISKRNSITNFRTQEFQQLFYNPGMILQWIYYQKFVNTDQYFTSLFNELDYEYTKVSTGMNQSGRDQRYGLRYRSMHEHKTKVLANTAPEEASTDQKLIPGVPTELTEFRFLDDQNRPYSRLIAESDPKKAFFQDLGLNEDFMFREGVILTDDSTTQSTGLEWYDFKHTAMILNEDGEITQTSTNNPYMVIDDSKYEENTLSSFKITDPKEDMVVNIESILINNHPDTSPFKVTSFSPDVRAHDMAQTKLKEPLSTDRDDLVISDLVFGFRDDESPVSGVIFPFVITNNYEIFEGDNLFVHFEAYHLKKKDNGLSELEISYEIRENKKGLFSGSGMDPLKVSLSFPSDTDYVKENLEIESSRLVYGDYEIEFTFTDKENGNKQTKKITFTVL